MDEHDVVATRSRRTGAACARSPTGCSVRPPTADDAVQEGWLRLSRTGADEIDNLDGWLTTVVAAPGAAGAPGPGGRAGGGDQSGGPRRPAPPIQARQRQIVGAFLAASKSGDLEALVALLDPDVVLRADSAAVATGAPAEVHGSAAVAETFAGRAKAARPALVGGDVGLVWAPGGTPRVAFALSFGPDSIVGIELSADPESLELLDPVLLPPDPRRRGILVLCLGVAGLGGIVG